MRLETTMGVRSSHATFGRANVGQRLCREAMTKAFGTEADAMKEIGGFFGLQYSTISRIINRGRDVEWNGRTLLVH